MDALARHRMLLLAGIAVPTLRVPAPVELRDEPDVDDLDPEDVEDDDEEEDLDEELDDEPDEDLEDDDDVESGEGELEEDDLDDEADEPEDEPESAAMLRHRQLQMLGIEARARSNPAPGRQVNTPEGARKYGLPIGSTILPGMRALTAAQQSAVAALGDEDRPKYLQARREGATHAAAMKAAGGGPAKAARPGRVSPLAAVPKRPRSKSALANEAQAMVDESIQSEDWTPEQHREYARRLNAMGDAVWDAAISGALARRLKDRADAQNSMARVKEKKAGRQAPPAKKATPPAKSAAAVAGDYVPRHIQGLLDYLDGTREPDLPLSVLFTTLNRYSYEHYLTREQRQRVLREAREILPKTQDREVANPDLPGVGGRERTNLERVITDIESIDGAAAKKATPAKAATPRIGPMGEPNALDRRMVRQYMQGASLAEIAETEGVSASTVHKSLVQQGLQLRPRGGARTPAKKAAPLRKPSDIVGPERDTLAADVVKRYTLGRESVEDIAASLSYSDGDATRTDLSEAAARRLVRELLRERGVELRPAKAAAPAKAAKRAPAGQSAPRESATARRQRLGQSIESLPDGTTGQGYYEALQDVPDGDLPAIARYLGARFPTGLTDPDARRRELAHQLNPDGTVDRPATPTKAAPPPAPQDATDLDSMSFAQLMLLAQQRGITVPDGATQEDILRLLRGGAASARHRELQLLGIESRADVNPKPGDNNLRNYWVYGKGRAKWNTFTELRRHLLEHVGPERADRIAAEWFHLRFGFWPGADVNRVRQGKPPRGKLVGPG